MTAARPSDPVTGVRLDSRPKSSKPREVEICSKSRRLETTLPFASLAKIRIRDCATPSSGSVSGLAASVIASPNSDGPFGAPGPGLSCTCAFVGEKDDS